MSRKIIALILALCALFSSAAAAALPEGISFRLANDARFAQTHTLEDYYLLDEDTCFVLLRSAGTSLTLCQFELAGEDWGCLWANQLINSDQPAALSDRTDSRFVLRTPAEGAARYAITFRKRGNEWYVTKVADNQAAMSAEMLTTKHQDAVYYRGAFNGLGFLQFTRQSRLASTFQPRVLSYLTRDLSQFFDLNVPCYPLPGVWTNTYVSLNQTIRIAVHSGPGYDYMRARHGKAALGCSRPFSVLGKCDGWLMVLYSVSEGYNRVGYIDYSRKWCFYDVAQCVNEIRFANKKDIFTTREDVPVYDDPINAGHELTTLPMDHEVTVLAQDSRWNYIETKIRGEWVRGFVAREDLAGR